MFTHVNDRPRANTASGRFLLPTLCTPAWLGPGSPAARELTSMELAMLRHSSMPGISSCSTFRSLHRRVMVPEEPASLGEAEGGSGLAVGLCRQTDRHATALSCPLPPGVLSRTKWEGRAGAELLALIWHRWHACLKLGFPPSPCLARGLVGAMVVSTKPGAAGRVSRAERVLKAKPGVSWGAVSPGGLVPAEILHSEARRRRGGHRPVPQASPAWAVGKRGMRLGGQRRGVAVLCRGRRESSGECPPAKAGVTPLEGSTGLAVGRDPPLLHGIHVADEQPELHGAGLGVPPGAGGEEQVVAGDAQGALHRRQPRARQQHALHRRRLDQLGELHGGAGGHPAPAVAFLCRAQGPAAGGCCRAGGRKGKSCSRPSLETPSSLCVTLGLFSLTPVFMFTLSPIAYGASSPQNAGQRDLFPPPAMLPLQMGKLRHRAEGAELALGSLAVPRP